ncbi:hypothetical protein GCM10009304_00070 [Pseudomonas matsuisoli]|uniref:Uncharacterized protein n=1 Tax=Pseudomonas matsuisoli TaxID=1515666 RepID=A0A917PHH6_9PSED|nr:hypothetical protein [Pseudomonas matsuisoli]GGJ78111.1 hypothetical protein GCM10009304_00070 [Pseudomonas matsuisoli]
MSTVAPPTNVMASQQSSSTAAFDEKLNIAKSSKALADYLKQKGKSAVNTDEMKQLATNAKGDVPAEVSSAAAYLVRHEDVFTAIETHDVAGADGLSGVWNFEWAAQGGLDGTSVAAIAAMTDAFDRAIAKSAQITEITTGKKTELDATKQRPSN